MKKITSREISKTGLLLEPSSGRSDSYKEFKKFGGWDTKLEKFTPIQFALLVLENGDKGSSTNYALDCIALSFEAGFFVESESFLKGTFAAPKDLIVFCEQLQEYDFWLNERHFYAFLELLQCDESEIKTYEDVGRIFYKAFRGL
jgi:hypothetical protein